MRVVSDAEPLVGSMQAVPNDKPRRTRDSRTAVEPLLDRQRFDELAKTIGGNGARALFDSSERADVVCFAWAELAQLRQRKRSELEQLLTQPHSATPDFQLQHQLDDAAETLASLESEIVSAFSNPKLLKRVSAIVADHSLDGFLLVPPVQWDGYPRRRLKRDVFEAYRCSLPVVEAVYDDPNALALSDSDFLSELVNRLGAVFDRDSKEASEFGWLETKLGHLSLTNCAGAIHSVRMRLAPRAVFLSEPDQVSHVLKHLRHSAFVKWLRPLGNGDSCGSGPVVASYHFIESTTGVGWASVRNDVLSTKAELDGRVIRVSKPRLKSRGRRYRKSLKQQ
jgi:hypothetical protein